MKENVPNPVARESPTHQSADRELRFSDPALRSARQIALTFDGRALHAYDGETIAAALAASGIAELGRRRDGSPRGTWCGMGVCQECLVNIDGVPSFRACMTAVTDGMTVASQRYAATVPASPSVTKRTAPELHRVQVLVVGAGPAGLSAARAAALCGAKVTVIDERATPGGQYFKQIAKSHDIIEPRRVDAQVRGGRELIAEVEGLGVTICREATVWGAFSAQAIAVNAHGAQQVLAAERLVLATGVYERGVPVPGWTLPGYMTTGAAQTLLRAYRVLPGRRVVVAGNGPLNLQLAAELVAAGAIVVAVVEAAPRPGLRRGAQIVRAIRASPRLRADGVTYLARLRRACVPLIYGSAVVGVQGDGRVEACTVTKIDAKGHPLPGTSIPYVADTVCVGYGFLPSNEIARALGCRHRRSQSGSLSTITDDHGLTSVAGVYAIGDMVALTGAHAARSQGFITGCAIAESLGRPLPLSVARELAVVQRELRRHLSFQQALWQLFAAPPLRAQLATKDTIVCRCEGVSRATIDRALQGGAVTLGAVKRRTRAGMGRCQGRYCESLVAAMLPQETPVPRDELFEFAPRAPIKPMRVKDLTSSALRDDE
jgi:D-hydroxyproline dehydrogenase subunit alpha